MKSFMLCVLFASIAFGQDHRVVFDSHNWGLTFGLTNLSENVKTAICSDMNIGLSRFGANDFALDATAYSGSEEPFQGSLNFMISSAAIPWGCGGMPYTVTNGVHRLYLLGEICESYTNAIHFTNEHAAVIRKLSSFIEDYGHSYTNFQMSLAARARLMWNPKVMNLLTPEKLRALCDSNVPTNGPQIVAYPPSILEYKVMADASYTNIPLIVCGSTAKFSDPPAFASQYGLEPFFARFIYVFVEGGWRIFLPEMP